MCARQQIVYERNAIVHVAEYEGDPSRRPFTREELMIFFDHCDERVNRLRRLRRKGSLAALRDTVLFKTLYAWGLRRQEAARLDVCDFYRNPASVRRSAATGCCTCVTGSPRAAARPSAARWRPCLTGPLRSWSSTCRRFARSTVAMSIPRCCSLSGRAPVATEITDRFAACREAAGLPAELSPHALRHSYVTHLIEDGFDELFVRMQVGHRYASTTALYTGVSGDYKNDAMRRALRAQLAVISREVR